MNENKKPKNPKITQQDVFEQDALTLRDYFAAKAMQGMMSNGITIDIDKDYPFQRRAEAAYLIADAMLKEREK